MELNCVEAGRMNEKARGMRCELKSLCAEAAGLSERANFNFKLNVRHPSAFKNAKLVSSPARFLVNYSGGYIP